MHCITCTNLPLFGIFGSRRKVTLDLDPSHPLVKSDGPFDDWLSYRGLPRQKVAISHNLPEGRGLVATRHVRRNEKLLNVPAKLLLTADAALGASAYGSLLESSGVPAWSVLATFLAETRYQPEGERNEWREYVDALPSQTGCVLEWTPEEMALLRGTAAMRAADEIVTACTASVGELEPILRESASKPGGPLTGNDLRWGFSMLLSRLVRLPGKQDEEACIPWADLLNHSPSAECFLDWDSSSSSVVLRTDRSYQPGEQVYVSYGQKSDAQLLLSYGFMPAPLSNPYNACSLRLGLRDDDPLYDMKRTLLEEDDHPACMEFPLRLDSLPQNLFNYAEFLATSSPDRKVASLIKQETGASVNEVAIDLIVKECKAALGAIPGTIDTDQEALDKVKMQIARGTSADAAALQRRGDILQIRINERKILNRTLFTLRRQIAAT